MPHREGTGWLGWEDSNVSYFHGSFDTLATAVRSR
jgi:hypothetical protein